MKYTIGFDGSGVDELLRAVEDCRKSLASKMQEFIKRLAEYGVTVANAGFESAVYDGTNDFSVSFEERGETTRAVVAKGATVLFVEFGTGIRYPDSHPDKPAEVSARGTYGHGLGKLEGGWRYPAEYGAGSNGEIDFDHPGYIHTHGNPANMPMYNARKAIEQDFEKIAREVFDN